MRCASFARVILLSIVWAMPGAALAGDEVDYSAPYLTVENGELVTKYPAKGHSAGAETPVLEPSSEVQDSDGKTWLFWCVLVAVLIVVVATIFRGRMHSGVSSR